jgi:alkanesulfonate monooxygenase SsuD/methylene tetrahydromethanopterin reductase-like flavin-dependent oxidoreductase (luciferase family)
MVPDPLQLLTYFAARTKRIDFGSMVVVLPWHHPVRVAEQVAMLDNMLDGRKLIVGVGRGSAKPEFDGFGVDMADTRELFHESVEILQCALTKNRFSYYGKHYTIDEMTVRPRPRSPQLADRMVCSWMSPQSLEIAAHLGLGMLFVTGKKPIESDVDDVRRFNAIRVEHGWGPLRPNVFHMAYCARDGETAEGEATRRLTDYFAMASKHHQFGGDHFKRSGVDEWYAETSEAMKNVSAEEAGAGAANSAIFGTPAECAARIDKIRELLDPEHMSLCFGLPLMSYDQIAESMTLFAREALPAVRAFDPELDARRAPFFSPLAT